MDSGNSNGDFRRRLSPRLHTNVESHDAGGSLRSRPRILNNSPLTQIDSSPVQPKLNPKSPQFHTPNSFQRRMSPRLHGEKDTVSLEVSPDVHVISVHQAQTRLSPRLHPKTLTNTNQRRISPRIHNDQMPMMSMRLSPTNHCENDNENKTLPTTSMQRRLSPRLHIQQNQNTQPETPVGDKRSLNVSPANNNTLNGKRSKHDHKDDKCKKDFEYSFVNGITGASNGEAPHQFNMALKALANEAKKQDTSPDVAGRSDHARVKETLRIFNTYYLQCVQVTSSHYINLVYGVARKSNIFILTNCYLHCFI